MGLKYSDLSQLTTMDVCKHILCGVSLAAFDLSARSRKARYLTVTSLSTSTLAWWTSWTAEERESVVVTSP